MIAAVLSRLSVTTTFQNSKANSTSATRSPAAVLTQPTSVSTKVGWVRTAAGERVADVELALLFWKVVVTDNRESTAAIIAGQRQITPEQVLVSPYFLLGSMDEITQQVETLRAHCGISYFSVFPGDVESFATVVARLAGR